MRIRPAIASFLALVFVLAGCAPAAPSGSGPAAAETPRAPKLLTIGSATELGSFGDFAGGGGTGGGCGECRAFAHDHLTDQRPDGVVEARLAAAVPSLEASTWKLNPDGSMDLTWKLRPNVKWHDGSPFTSEDMLFTYTLYKDPDLPTLYAGQLAMMTSASAPDPQTFIVHWSKTYVYAHRQPSLEPMPKHLLGDAYARGEKNVLTNSPLLTTEFVGLGPYRLTRWEAGSFMQYERFDGYYLGTPPLDRVTLQFIKDPNTLIANLLAGSVEAGSHNSIDLATGLDVKQRWTGTGNTVDIEPTNMTIQMQMQFRSEYRRLNNAFAQRPVRQALYSAIDRTTLVDVMQAGLAPVADSWYPPDLEIRKDIESAIPQYRYDPAAAQRQLADAGWTRGADGVLIHTSGERFQIELWAKAKYSDKPISVIADNWKTVGVQSSLNAIPAARDGDREYEVTYPDTIFTNPPSVGFYEDYRLHGGYIAGPENRWTGRNQPGYSNPRFDSLLDRLQTTIDRKEQIDVTRQLIQEAMTDVAIMPLYWEVRPYFMLQGITRDRNRGPLGWDKKS
jgi:ABC-type transport system substrate-binding protein